MAHASERTHTSCAAAWTQGNRPPSSSAANTIATSGFRPRHTRVSLERKRSKTSQLLTSFFQNGPSGPRTQAHEEAGTTGNRLTW